jgi:hypothetical protein
MIQKSIILYEKKLVINKFLINKFDNKIIVKSLDYTDFKIPIYNKYNGIDYYPIYFPLVLPIIDNYVYNPYIVLSSYNINIDNDIDFFYQLKQNLKNFYNYNYLIDNPYTFVRIMNEYYSLNQNIELKDTLDEYIISFWFNINIIKTYIIFILIKFPNITNKTIKDIHLKYNIPKKILTIANNIKSIKYSITSDNYKMTISEYYNFNYNVSLKLLELKNYNYYYIVKSDNLNKVIKIYINKINKNLIYLNETTIINFNNYYWYHFHPDIKINKEYIIYQTFINFDFTHEIIKYLLNIIDASIIIDYYMNEKKTSNLILLSDIYKNNNFNLTDIQILKSNSFTDTFFKNITEKSNDVVQILTILFDNYQFPLKSNRHDIEYNFDYILYYSLYHYKLIFNIANKELYPEVNNIIPNKVKNLYINMIKIYYQIINNDFEGITYNQKFYNDYLHRNIIKLFFIKTDRLSINYFHDTIEPFNFNKFKNIVFTNMLLVDIASKLSWNNITKKLNYLNYFYQNNSIIYYQDKINKNIIPDNFDYRIKKIIENPFEMYKYLRKESDFIKWSKFISDKIINLYIVPITLSVDDVLNFGKIIYLLLNVTDQHTKEPTYIKFINFCNLHTNLILDGLRINLNIKEFFHILKTNINLGFLAKHLTWDKEAIIFDDLEEKPNEIIKLEEKLELTMKKYNKYKAKYLSIKTESINSDSD